MGHVSYIVRIEDLALLLKVPQSPKVNANHQENCDNNGPTIKGKVDVPKDLK